ncbi:hypothetical protein AKO1_012977 [Acrasis kona]|uniref:Uncharacterized protein n=1 Tax=Acrasis kona TaxID=1008807 RepID=A0AAW2YZ73_9EUKA
MDRQNQTFTLTFGDQAENHVGMQKVGSLSSVGYNREDLCKAQEWFEKRDAKCELINLPTFLPDDKTFDGDALVLVVRNGLKAILTPQYSSDEFFEEQSKLPKDSKALMYGRVVRKKARHNLCFADESQEPDYENGKGRLVSYESVPILKKVRRELVNVIGDKAKDLVVEGNYYYDKSCGIGFHGDAERMKVIGVRVGATIPLHFQWFQKCNPVGSRIKINLSHGDMYIMCQKATGNDFKKKNILTLRHAAGHEKYLTIKTKKRKLEEEPKKIKRLRINKIFYKKFDL